MAAALRRKAALPTIKASPDFQRIARDGKRWSGPAFIVQVLKTDATGAFRIGFTASRKVGGAVVRNRAKRRLREVVRHFIRARHPQGFEMVLIAKTAATERDFKALQADLDKAVLALGVAALPAVAAAAETPHV